jgi:septin family protein
MDFEYEQLTGEQKVRIIESRINAAESERFAAEMDAAAYPDNDVMQDSSRDRIKSADAAIAAMQEQLAPARVQRDREVKERDEQIKAEAKKAAEEQAQAKAKAKEQEGAS